MSRWAPLRARLVALFRRLRARPWGLGWLMGSTLVFALVGAFVARFGSSNLSFAWAGRELSFAEPRAIWLLFLLPLLWGAQAFSLTGLSTTQRVASALVRSAFLLSLIVGLGQVIETERTSRLCAVALLDVSDSVSDEGVERARAQLMEWRRARPEEDTLELLVFGENVAHVDLPRDVDAPVPSVAALRGRVARGASDLERALGQADAYRSMDCLPRTILLTDGIETRGDVVSMFERATADSGRIHVLSTSTPPPPDLAIVGMDAPSDLTVGRTFELRVEVSATQAARGKLVLFQGDGPNALEPERTIENLDGSRVLAFQSVVRVPGPIVYRAQVRPEGPDRHALNDVASLRLDVPGPPRVLVVDREPVQSAHLVRALAAQQFDVESRAPLAFPASPSELSALAFVVLSDVARADLGRAAEQLLVSYVRSGGGLLYSGGEAGYGPGGWQGSELEKILPVRMDDEKRRETPGVAISLVIDRSGSMIGLPLEMAKQACAAAVDVLESTDLFEVIAFDSKPVRYVKMQPARYRAQIQAEIQRIQPGGGTEIFQSLDMAYQDLSAVTARKKHMVLLTDGNASAEGISDLVSTAFGDGITVTSVGLGTGINEEHLRMIAEMGGGRFHAAAEPSSLPQIFTRETEIVSQRASQEDWIPVVVARQADFMNGIAWGSAPLVRGYTRVQLAPAPAELLLQTESGDPILARQRAGLGATLAWTSDLKTRWGKDWLAWSAFGKFIGQLVRAHQEKDDEKTLPLEVALVGDRARLAVDAFDRDDRFDNQLLSTVKATYQDAAGKSHELAPFPLRLSRPGRYEAELELPSFGSYSLLVEHRRRQADGSPGAVAFTSRGSLSYPYPEELRRLTSNPAVLGRWAELGRGRLDPDARTIWSSLGDERASRVGRQEEALFLALALLLLDLLLRRVRFGRAPALGV